MKVDIAIAGGGLSGALLAWRLATERPELSIAVVERSRRLGGNHTWSFHDTDLPREIFNWVAPLIVKRWPSQQVRFPGQSRRLNTGYCSITSERLHDVIAPTIGRALVPDAEIVEIDHSSITLADQRVIEANAVVDARGKRQAEHLTIGFQKFVGQLLRFKRPHGLDAPIIMDATVRQTDGYRFVYVLPFGEDTALVEDTYYADGAELDRELVTSEIASYCRRSGWDIAEVVGEEDGLLPIALAGDIDAHLADAAPGVAQIGLGAGLFHPLTGYSFPDAAQTATLIADAPDLSGAALHQLTTQHARTAWADRSFYRMLSRFLFYAARPEERYKVLARFYRLPQPLIERFYAGSSTGADKFRVLVGKPPVNFLRAAECVSEEHWQDNVWARRSA